MSAEKARSFVIWLHGLGDSGPANEPLHTLFTSPEFRNTTWSYPTTPSNPVTCNYGRVMPSWFDIHKMPVTGEEHLENASDGFTCSGKLSKLLMTANLKSSNTDSSGVSSEQESGSPEVTTGLLDSVKRVHGMIDEEVASGTDPRNIFVCGLSQGGALTLASVLLYPKTLGGAAVFSGWVPANASLLKRVTPEARKTPMLWSHGTDDLLILFEAGKAGHRFLKKAGVNCEFKVYPGLRHVLLNKELLYLENWMKPLLPSP
uniref:Phospholipase/carboxylesterase/thioesterase domain-containing protein n=1 Tax=Kalanchoe fedtschenkoi TaxID=63787 RepID=A0A7N0UEA3_KALFE